MGSLDCARFLAALAMRPHVQPRGEIRMQEPTTNANRFRVIDDVLVNDDFVLLWRDVQRLRFDFPSGECNIPDTPRPDEWGQPFPADGPISNSRLNECPPNPTGWCCLEGGVWNFTKRVDPAAGNHIRCSITAFVHSKDNPPTKM